MSDNLRLNPLAHGAIVASDEIQEVNYLRVKMGYGAEGSYTDVDENNRLPVINAGSSPLNVAFAENSTATTVRAVTEERLIAEGLFNGRTIVTKFGRNPDIDTATVPEDVWGGAGLYTGFPTGSAEEFQAVSTNAGDTGVVTFTYLASFTATAWQTATVTLNGTTPVNTGITGVRCHTARYNNSTADTFNLGDITIRHAVTTTNVFLLIPIGRSQSNNAAYTIPFGSRGYIKRLFVRDNSNVSGFVEGAVWVRAFGESPRLRRPLSAVSTFLFEEEIYGGLELQQLTDIHVRILSCSVNNAAVTAGYDLIVVPN